MRPIVSMAALMACMAGSALAAPPPGDWPTYGRDRGGQRHSPLSEITPANVGKLQPAWVYHMKPPETEATQDPAQVRAAVQEGQPAPPPRPRFLASQMTPLVVGGRMYISTPYGRVAALDAATGKEIWVTPIGGVGMPSYRGVEYWAGDKDNPPRLVFGTGDGRLIALDAKTGAFVPTFGDRGTVNLKTAEIMNGFDRANYSMTTPPVISGNLIITGARVQEQPLQGPAGDVRAWDVRTGKLVWTFHTLPRPGEPNNGTWTDPASMEKRSGLNVWGFMTVDEARGILYMPVAGAAYDRYGGDRPGDNLYGSSLVAVDLKTGKYRWHFQMVHHDIWDVDAQGAPLLFDAKVGGRTIPAVSITSKNGLMFMFDRVSGKPIHAISEKPFPKSNAPGEITSPTQPIPATPALARTSISLPDEIADVTPELKAWCENLVRTEKIAGTQQYEPFHVDTPAVHYPGTEGGASWGGQTLDPKSGLLIVPTNNLGLVAQLVKNEGPVAYRTVFKYFQKPDERLHCVKPPWATLNAVDSKTGKIAWQAPLGITDNVPAAVANTGRPGNGGAITTDGGLVFIGFTDDSRFRAFDVRNGKELWTYKLEASAHATPITYQAGGRQYVAVTSTGGSYVASPVVSDTLTAFALPK